MSFTALVLFLQETGKYNLIGSYCWFILVFFATAISYVIKANLVNHVLLLQVAVLSPSLSHGFNTRFPAQDILYKVVATK